eukprot:g5717.t1
MGLLVLALAASGHAPISPPYPPESHNGTLIKHFVKKQFARFDANYSAARAARDEAFAAANTALLALQAAGHEVPCSYQIATEVEWRIHHTANWSAVDAGMARLWRSLRAPPAQQAGAGTQQPADGSWAPCSSVLWVKLASSQDGLYPYARADATPPYPLRFLQQSPLRAAATLLPHLRSLLVSDVAADGVDHRTELSNTITFVSKLVQLRDWANRRLRTSGIVIDDAYVDAYYSFLDELQDPQTGFWGAQYVYGYDTVGADERAFPAPTLAPAPAVISTTDLSMTFHITKYRGGAVRHAGNIAATVLLIRDQPYPYGWGLSMDPDSSATVFDNHNSFDVATLLSFTWAAGGAAAAGASAAAWRAAARAAMTEMLKFALGPRSLVPDGSALVCGPGQSSLGDCYYFTLGLLDVSGFWNGSRLFWA